MLQLAKKSVPMLLIGFVATLIYITYVGFVHAQATCENVYGGGSTPPAGFAPVYDVFGGQGVLVRAEVCMSGVAKFVFGSEDNLDAYVYKTGYFWTGSGWFPFDYEGLASTGEWLTREAVGVPSVSAPGTWVASYICHLRDLDDWRCGCVDETCEGDSAQKWSLQGVRTNQTCATMPCEPPTWQYLYTDGSCDGCGYTCHNYVADPENGLIGTPCWDTSDTCLKHVQGTTNNARIYGCVAPGQKVAIPPTSTTGNTTGGSTATGGNIDNVVPTRTVDAGPEIVPDGDTWYIDSVSGNNSNSGQSEGQAWRTLSAINGKSFPAGAQILLKRGSTFAGQVPIPSGGSSHANPIAFGTYGSGAKPIIRGNGTGIALAIPDNMSIIIDGIVFDGFTGGPCESNNICTRGVINVGRANDVIIRDVEVKNFQITGIGGNQGNRPTPGQGRPQHPLTIVNSRIENGRTGIFLENWQDAFIEGNQIYNMGDGGVAAKNSEFVTIRGNHMNGMGRFGVDLPGPYQGHLVQGNLVENYMRSGNDYGAIYSWDNAPFAKPPGEARSVGTSYIVGNLVRNGTGSGAHSGNPLVFGIYLDDNSTNWVVRDNVVIASGQELSSIYLHNTRKVLVDGNIVTGAREGLLVYESRQVYSWAGRVLTDNTVTNNTFLTGMAQVKGRGQTHVANLMSEYGKVDDFVNVSSGNIYANPSGPANAIRVREPGSGTRTMNLDAWRNKSTGNESGSRFETGQWEVLYNDSLTQSRTVNLGGRRLIDGSSPGSVTLAPLEAVVVSP